MADQTPRKRCLTPFEQGLADGEAATARGEVPSQAALDRAAAIIANSRALKQLLASEDEGATAD